MKELGAKYTRGTFWEYIETSALTGYKVGAIFTNLVRYMREAHFPEPEEPEPRKKGILGWFY